MRDDSRPVEAIAERGWEGGEDRRNDTLRVYRAALRPAGFFACACRQSLNRESPVSRISS